MAEVVKRRRKKVVIPVARLVLIAGKLANGRRCWGDALAAECGLSLSLFFRAVSTPWFTIDVGGYKLTRRGIEGVKQAGGGADMAQGGVV